jgi:Spy/CpxP family protein refolding chaperone
MTRLPWILLGLSAVFNFAFGGGFLHARHEYDLAASADEQPQTDAVADRLGLDDDQRQRFAELQRKLRDREREIDEAAFIARQELWKTMSDPAASAADVEAAQEALADLHREARRIRIELFRQFMGTLRPEQRARALRRIRRQYLRRPMWRSLLNRFDVNRNGRLDPAEWERAREAIRRRVGGRGLPGRRGRAAPAEPQRPRAAARSAAPGREREEDDKTTSPPRGGDAA